MAARHIVIAALAASLAGAWASSRTEEPHTTSLRALAVGTERRMGVVAEVSEVAGVARAVSVPMAAPSTGHRVSVGIRREARAMTSVRCGSLMAADLRGRFIARADLAPPLAPVDGDDLLALVDRSARFGVSAGYAPRDLVDLGSFRAATASECEPPGGQCLRREAAVALRAMLAAMRAAGLRGYIHSAFRAFDAQCGVFRRWSVLESQGMCRAATASALAGHSQHQLGTAIDLFTEEWARGGQVLRAGFGCTDGGRWFAEHGWEFGFVLPYPLPLDERAEGSRCERRRGAGDGVDPRTGYRYEPWHLRYIGVEHAQSLRDAAAASGDELTLGQWLRSRAGIDGEADLPVCDGCACGACTTFASDAELQTPCAGRALELGPDGEPVAIERAPEIAAVRAVREGISTRVTVTLSVGRHTVTQPPVLGVAGARRAYPELAGAWRVAIESPSGFSVRVAMVADMSLRWLNGANQRLPVNSGELRLSVEVPAATVLRVGLSHDGVTEGVRTIEVR